MSNQYISLQVRLACLTKRPVQKKDIHEMLAQTIATRKIILARLEATLQVQAVIHLLHENEIDVERLHKVQACY